MSISSTAVHRAEIKFQEATEALRPFVGCFWVVTAEQGATIRAETAEYSRSVRL
jgi:hypothetical protein